MEYSCCMMVLFCIIGYAMVKIEKAKVERKQAETKTKNEKNESYQEALNEKIKVLDSQNDYIIGTLKSLFIPGADAYKYIYQHVDDSIKKMNLTISEIEKINEKLVNESFKENRSTPISQSKLNTLIKASSISEELKKFEQKVYALPLSRMLDEKSYGKINKKYWDTINELERTMVVSYIAKCEKLLDDTRYDSSVINNAFAINIEEVLQCVWFFATEKIFSVSDFRRAESVFYRIYKYRHIDVILADLYAKKKMGGEDVLKDSVRELIKEENDPQTLTLIASGMMWMNAYQSENTVLQHMLKRNIEMPEKAQERLHSLKNGGGKAPSGFDVKSSKNLFYFDVSALAWKDDEYIGFFENLSFQDKTLTYSLAVRDENKDLFIAQGVNVPGRGEVVKKFAAVFVEEYGSNVMIQEVNCIALSGSDEEKMDGVLVSSNECKQMGILIHIARIGKKLIIKFYTLFMPTNSDLAVQKQQVLSMHKKLSPSVTMWESSLKDTMLMAVEQLLNAGVASGTAKSENMIESDGVDSDEPIF